MVSKEIILNSIKGEREAHRNLYNSCAPYVYSIVRNYIQDNEYRKDAVQEVFAQIFFSLKNFDSNKGTFKSWMGRLTVNRCITLLKKTNKIDLVPEKVDTEEIPDYTMKDFDQLTKENIEEMLGSMPGGYRTVFLLNVIDDYTHKEIAEMLQISIGTSRSQLNRGLKWMRSNLSLELELK